MATETLLKCYSYETIDFIPEKQLLIWHDQRQTLLSREEAQLLGVLCLFAGEVVNADALYRHTFTSLDAFEETSDHTYDLNQLLVSLTGKLQCNGEMAIPIHVVPHYGFRVPLPTKTSRRNPLSLSLAPLPPAPSPIVTFYQSDLFKRIVLDFIWLKVGILFTFAAAVGAIMWWF